jgi:hypothetical protein
MARFSAGVKTGAGSTTLPIISLYSGGAASAPRVREVGVFNTTNTAFDIKLVRLTATGTQGAGLTEAKHDNVTAALATAFTTHTVAPTLGDDLGYRASIGAAIGAGVIWSFGDIGLLIPAGTGNGIGVIVENGTGQIAQAYLCWDE